MKFLKGKISERIELRPQDPYGNREKERAFHPWLLQFFQNSDILNSDRIWED